MSDDLVERLRDLDDGCLRVAADRIEALEAENARMREELQMAARGFHAIRGAVESNQVEDKDVRGTAISFRDRARAALGEE